LNQNDRKRETTAQAATLPLLLAALVPIFLSVMTQNQKFRIAIAVALILGWIVVIFLRSGTAWG
jgi:uncharacterized membrane protein